MGSEAVLEGFGRVLVGSCEFWWVLVGSVGVLVGSGGSWCSSGEFWWGSSCGFL